MPANPELLALVDAQSKSRQSISDKVIAYLMWLWRGFDGWYKPSLVDEVSQQAWQAVSAGQAATAAVTDQYLAQTSSLVRGSPVAPVGVGPDMRKSLRFGVSGPEVQARIASEFRWQVYRNETLDVALAKATDRIETAVSEDLALAVQRQAASFQEVRKVRTFMRVTRGENTCGLCAAASNQLYFRQDLMPIHARCRCTVIETSPQAARKQRKQKGMRGRDDDGEYMALSDADYQRLTGVTRGLYGRDLKDIRYVVDENGELGPVLRNLTQKEATVRRLKDGSYETTGGYTRPAALQGPREDTVDVPRKDKRTPQQKRLSPSDGLDGMSPADARGRIGAHEKALSWAKMNDLPEQVSYHSERVRLLRVRAGQ